MTTSKDKGVVSNEKTVPNFTDGKDDQHVATRDVPPPKADPERVQEVVAPEPEPDLRYEAQPLPRAHAEMPAAETDPKHYAKLVAKGFIIPEEQPYDENR